MSTKVILNSFEQDFDSSLSVLRSCFYNLNGMSKPISSNEFNKKLGNVCQNSGNFALSQSIIGIICMVSAVSSDGYTYIDTNDYQNKFFRKIEKIEPNIPIERIKAALTPNNNKNDNNNNDNNNNDDNNSSNIHIPTKSLSSNHSLSSDGDIHDHLHDDDYDHDEQALDNTSLGSDLPDDVNHFLDEHIDDDQHKNDNSNSSGEKKKKEIVTNFDDIPDDDEDEHKDHDIIRRLTEIGVQPSASDLQILRDKFKKNSDTVVEEDDDDDDYDDEYQEDEYEEEEKDVNVHENNTNNNTTPDANTNVTKNDNKNDFKNEFAVEKNEFAVNSNIETAIKTEEEKRKDNEKQVENTEVNIIVSTNTGENINIHSSIDLPLALTSNDNINEDAIQSDTKIETKTIAEEGQVKNIASKSTPTPTVTVSPIRSHKPKKKSNRIKTIAQQEREEHQVTGSITDEKIASLETALRQLQTDNNIHNLDRSSSQSRSKNPKKKVWIPLWEGRVDRQGPTSGVADPSLSSTTATLTVTPVDEHEQLKKTANRISESLNKMDNNSKDMLGVLRTKAGNTNHILNEMYEVIDELLQHGQDTRMKELLQQQLVEEKDLHREIRLRHNQIDVHTLRHLGVDAAELVQVKRDLASRTSALYPDNYTDVERYIERRRAEQLYIDNKEINDLRVRHKIQKEKILRCLDIPKLLLGQLYNRQMNVVKNATIKGEKAARRAMVLLQSLRSHDTLKEEVWRAPVRPSEIGAKVLGLTDPHVLRDTPFSPGAFHVKQSSPTNASLKREITALKKKESASNIGIKHLMRMRNATSAINFEDAHHAGNQIDFQQECSDLKEFMATTLKELKPNPDLNSSNTGAFTFNNDNDNSDKDKLLTQFEMSSNMALDHARSIVRSCVQSLVIQVNSIRWLYKAVSGSNGIEVAASMTWERFLQHDKDGHGESRRRGRSSSRSRSKSKKDSKSRTRPSSADARFSGSSSNNTDMNGLTLSMGMTVTSPYKAIASAFRNTTEEDLGLGLDAEVEIGNQFATPMQSRSRLRPKSAGAGAIRSSNPGVQANDEIDCEDALSDFEDGNNITSKKKKRGKSRRRPASASSAAFPPMQVRYTDHIRPPYNTGYSANISSTSHSVYSNSKMKSTPMLTVDTHSGLPQVGASVRCRYHSRKKWVPAVIIACHDDDTYDVQYLNEEKEESRFHGYFKQKLHGGEVESFVPRSHIRVLDKALRAGSLYPLHPSVEATQKATKSQHELFLQSPRRTVEDDQVDAYISERWGSPLKITFKGLDVKIEPKDTEGEGDKSFMGLDRRKAPTPFTSLHHALHNGASAIAMKADNSVKRRPQSAPIQSTSSRLKLENEKEAGQVNVEDDSNMKCETETVDNMDIDADGYLDDDFEQDEVESTIKSRTNSSNNLRRLKSGASLLSNGLNESLASDEDEETEYDHNFEDEEGEEDYEADAFDVDEDEYEDDEPTAMLRRLDAERDPDSRQLNKNINNKKSKSLKITVDDDSNSNSNSKPKTRKKRKKRKGKKTTSTAVPETPPINFAISTRRGEGLSPLSRYPCVNCRRFFHGKGQELPDAVMIDRRMRHVCKEIAKDFFGNQNKLKQKQLDRRIETAETIAADSFDNKLDLALRTTLVEGVPGESEATHRLLFCGGDCILDWNRRTAPLQYRHRNELLLQIMIDAKEE